MTPTPTVFVDSDVIISSLLSQAGAAYLLLHQKNIKLFISNLSLRESGMVADKLNIPKDKFDNLVQKRVHMVKLKETPKELKIKYKNYVLDLNDAHIVAGSILAKVNFLISYNIRDFKVDKIKTDLGIICLTPGEFLQYLRSL